MALFPWRRRAPGSAVADALGGRAALVHPAPARALVPVPVLGGSGVGAARALAGRRAGAGARIARPTGRRAYASAAASRLNASFPGVFGTGDAEIRASLWRLRGRSRQLWQDSDLVRRFAWLLKQNVVGPRGLTLKMRARDPVTGELDRDANQRIEDRWHQFLDAGLFTVTGRLHGVDAQWQALETAARDGELFTRLVPNFDNAHRFAVQMLEADLVDEQLDRVLSRDRIVRMGIEVDRWQRPRAYWLRNRHPGDYYGSPGQTGAPTWERVDAEGVVHLFLAERPTQSRGVPWTHASALRVDMADGYFEAELVAARVASSKMGFYKTPSGGEYKGDDEDAETGAPVSEVEPGLFEELPDGWEVQAFDPQHPTTAFGPFLKAITRRFASGLNVSYHALANDLEGVNYSSGRIGELTDRDFWRSLQGWLARNWLAPIFRRWLTIQVDGGLLPLPSRKLEAYLAGACWQGRGWAWVDPAKEAVGKRESYALRVESLTGIALEQGRDLDDVLEEIAAERERMRELGIEPPAGAAGADAAALAAQPEDGAGAGQGQETGEG